MFELINEFHVPESYLKKLNYIAVECLSAEMTIETSPNQNMFVMQVGGWGVQENTTAMFDSLLIKWF